MKKRTQIFITLSLVIAIIDGVFVYANNRFAHEALLESLDQEGLQIQSSFDTLMDQTYNSMLVVATFISNDPEIQSLFLQGKKAVEAEGGGAGGEKAEQARNALFDKVGPNWRKVQSEFHVRQLHFHLGPGSTSFLRVHRPEKYGDNMDNVRFTIVDTNAQKTSRFGFETGRVYSGLRGVVPMTGRDTDTSQDIHLGALEVGTSFNVILKILDDRYGLGAGVLLTKEHIESAMWPDFIKKKFSGDQRDCECVIEAATRDGLGSIVDAIYSPDDDIAQRKTQMVKVGGSFYAVNRFPLIDYLGTKKPDRGPVGSVVFWLNADERMAAFNQSQRFNIAYGVMGYLLIELLMFFAFRYAMRHLELEVSIRTAELAELAKNEELLIDKLQYEVDVKNRFFSIISHDLKSPFNSLLGMTELMAAMSNNFDKDRMVQLASTVNQSGKRAFELLHNLLEWSRLQMNGGDFSAAQFALNEVVADSFNVLSPIAADKGVELLSSVSQTDAYGDHNMVSTVIRNLIGNALKFTPQGGRVEVSAQNVDDDYVQITVSDTGVGMEHDRVARLFDLDHRTSTLGTDGEQGTGLGLPLCKEMVEKNGGRIWLESVPGEGSSFHFTLQRKAS